MYQLKKKIEDIFLKLLLKKDFHEIEIIEIQTKSRISSKKFFQLFKTKEEIMISFFKRIDQILERKIKKINLGKNIKDNLLNGDLLLNIFRDNIEVEVERRTGGRFTPSLSGGVFYSNTSNTSFDYGLRYDEFFDYRLYQGFASCSENSDVMFAAITCSAE